MMQYARQSHGYATNCMSKATSMSGKCRKSNHKATKMNNFMSSFLRGQRRRAEFRHLQAMDDRLLADIGLSRSDVADLMSGSVPANLRKR
jgi:uncharacterized protein YjiS (DUF1127 family)